MRPLLIGGVLGFLSLLSISIYWAAGPEQSLPRYWRHESAGLLPALQEDIHHN